MKISIAISLLILAIASAVLWLDHQQLAVVREHHAQLVAEAATVGIALDPSHPADPVRVTKRERENREVVARQTAIGFIAFAKEMEAMEKKGGPPDEAMQKRIMEIMDRMMSLDSAQLKVVIAQVRADKSLKDETRNNLIGFSIMTLANDHPQAALALFTESSDFFKDNNMGQQVVSSSLSKWAKDDPTAALDWVRMNGEKFPDLVTDDARRGLISGTAANDPKLAFQLIGELGLKETSQAISGIMTAARTPAERTATLDAFRSYIATLPDGKERAVATARSIGNLARGLSEEGFASATHWIDSANLSPDELGGLAGNLSASAKTGETGQWIEWMGDKLPPEKAAGNITNIVRNWTENDYQAAGKWLATAPDGPARNASIRSYAETVARYEPETAAQWAMTLPAGKDRDATLRRIHDNWPKGDTAARQAFANEHGIK